MDEITKQIEEMAEKMEKSVTEPTEKLFAIIKSLGKDGLKAKLPTLSEEEKTVLKAALEEMTLKKAVSFDDVYAAPVINGKVRDTIIQEEIASDDADEKLVKLEAAKHNHQGGPIDGWEGQVIKSLEEDETQLDALIEKAMDKCNGDEKLVAKKLKEKGMGEKKVQGALDKFKMKKAMSKEEASKKIMAMEEKEHGTKNPKKLVEAEKKENMKKSEETEIVEKAIQTEIEPSETNQSGDAPDMKGGKTCAKKTPAPEIEALGKDNKKNMTKSLVWDDDQRLLKANTQGRNFTFHVGDFIETTIANEPTEVVQKSEDGKEDLNDLIQKGKDMSMEQSRENKIKEEAKKKMNGKMQKSFEDEDMAAAFGMTLEQYKTIVGE